MRVTVSNEAERSNKFSAGESTKANLVQDSTMQVNDYPSSNKVSDHKIKSEQTHTAKLLEITESLKSDVCNLKQEDRAQRVGNNDNVKVNNFHVSPEPKKVRQQCKKEGDTDGCTHFFHCFSKKHWYRGCKRKGKNLGQESQKGARVRGNPWSPVIVMNCPRKGATIVQKG